MALFFTFAKQKLYAMINDFKGTTYKLKSFKTGNEFSDKGWTLDAPNETDPTLIRAIYEKKTT